MADGGMGQKIGLVAAAVVGVVVVLTGIFYKTPTYTPPNTPAPVTIPAQTAPVDSSADPKVNLPCLLKHIQKAPSAFHLSFRKNSNVLSSDWEATVAPNSIDGTVVNSSGAQPIHALRSDRAGWGTAVTTLSAPISDAGSTFALVRDSSATMRSGMENVNGQKAIKYAIDTTRDAASDAGAIQNILGTNGFVKGTAWVTNDGCPVKFVLDVEMHLSDGNIEKQHYEEAVTLPASEPSKSN
jgi:hypothetical protein